MKLSFDKRSTILLLFISIALYIIASDWTNPPHYSEPRVILYSTETRDDLTGNFVEAIEKATRSVRVIIFALKDKKIIEALNKKAREGVFVEVLTDAKASHLSGKLDPAVKHFRRFIKGLMHLKVLVIDDRDVWVGSANMTTDSLRRYGNLVIKFSHPPLARFWTMKMNQLKRDTNTLNAVPENFMIGDQKVTVWLFPENQDGIRELKALIRSAKKTIKVAMYTWTRMDLAHELRFAKERGIDVSVALDRSSAEGVSKKVYHYLTQNNIPVFTNSGKNLLHHKFMLVDDQVLISGSANWTRAAFIRNDDCYVVIDSLDADAREKICRVWESFH